MLVLSPAPGCDSETKTAAARAAASAAARASAAPPKSAASAPEPPPPLPAMQGVERAWRCAECHEKMYDEWQGSPHAEAAKSELYQVLSKQADEHDCNRCHAPLKRRTDDERAAAEGVTCEVCHRMREVSVVPSGAGFELELPEGMKYGPLCDAAYPYFHEAECRPHFEKAEMCGSCHSLHYAAKPGITLPVYTEYDEWKQSEYARKGKVCQSCHMPGETAKIANGEKERQDVPHHNFMGGESSLLGTGLKASARVADNGENLTVEVVLENHAAGHALPGVHRELLLEIRVLSGDRSTHASATRSYARKFVDAQHRPAPFFLATRVERDNRIGPGQRVRERFDLAAPDAGLVSIRLLKHALAPAVAQRLHADVPDPAVVLAAEVRFARPGPAGKRRQLPKKVELSR